MCDVCDVDVSGSGRDLVRVSQSCGEVYIYGQKKIIKKIDWFQGQGKSKIRIFGHQQGGIDNDIRAALILEH